MTQMKMEGTYLTASSHKIVKMIIDILRGIYMKRMHVIRGLQNTLSTKNITEEV